MTQDHTQAFIVGCPACQKEIKVLPQFAGEIVQCPHCSKSMRVPSETFSASTAPPVVPSPNNIVESLAPPKSAVAPPTSTQEPDQPEALQTIEPNPLDELLPPKYQTEDYADGSLQAGRRSAVILPTAEGGTQTVDPNTVTIEYKGQKYVLTKLTPEQRERRRQIANAISILVAIIAIAVTVWILLG